jgi:transketolase
MYQASQYRCSDLKGIYDAISEGRQEKNKPTIVRLRTTIGFGSKQQGTHGVHGSRMSKPFIFLAQ